MVSAPAGSGKTVLLRTWIAQNDLAARVAWVPVGRDERDPQRLWLTVLAALRRTSAGSALVRNLTAAPDLDGWALVERLLKDLAPLDEPLWLVIDDVHELGSDQARRQLELLVLRAPPELRFVLATRHDLRLAALSLAGHPDPDRFAAEFSGSERTVAEYLLAEVLERQPEQVRRLLLRTSVLDRVNGELADLLTGGSGRERVLQDLEEANAFVTSLDATRSWFRYHHLFADLLRLELRRTEPGEVTALHELAATWFAGHELPVEAIRHAQAAQDWDLAAQLLADHWPGLHLDGQGATVHALLAGFPAGAAAANAGLRRWRRPTRLRRARWRPRRDFCGWRSADRGRSRHRSCSAWSGCCWPGRGRPAGGARASQAAAGGRPGPDRDTTGSG
jgi:LuxR family maltose regulon positive regulatory protein